MTVDLTHLQNHVLPIGQQRLTPRDCILYALGIGIGLDPTDEADLSFVDETRLRVVPSMVNVMADNGHWLRDLDPGLDWQQAVHGEQSMVIHAPLPHTALVQARSCIVDVIDKGPGRGAVLYVQREVCNAESGEHYATVLQTVFCRANGGFGGKSGKTVTSWEQPNRAPDCSIALSTSPQQALIYRLSGDDNLLHSDPAVARAAGFPRPILHGMATLGLVGHGLSKALCNTDPERTKALSGRFAAPVYPGETIMLDIWETDSGTALYQARVASRQIVVLTHGVFRYTP